LDRTCWSGVTIKKYKKTLIKTKIKSEVKNLSVGDRLSLEELSVVQHLAGGVELGAGFLADPNKDGIPAILFTLRLRVALDLVAEESK
jgi:hypothetical protein